MKPFTKNITKWKMKKLVIKIICYTMVFLGVSFMLSELFIQLINIPSSLFITYLGTFFLMGVVHLLLIKFHYDPLNIHFSKVSVFTIFLTLMGYLVLVLLLRFENISYRWLIPIAILVFLFPISVYKAFLTLLSIPKKIKKGLIIWNLGDNKEKLSFKVEKYEKQIKLIFKKDGVGYLPSCIMIPVNKKIEKLKLGDILKSAILYNNDNENPNNPINHYCLNNSGSNQPFTWFFQAKGILPFVKRNLDPDKSLVENSILLGFQAHTTL